MNDLFDDDEHRGDYGNPGRYLINKARDGKGWLLHEPIGPHSTNSAIRLSSFEDAVHLFKAFLQADQRRVSQ